MTGVYHLPFYYAVIGDYLDFGLARFARQLRQIIAAGMAALAQFRLEIGDAQVVLRINLQTIHMGFFQGFNILPGVEFRSAVLNPIGQGQTVMHFPE